MCTTTHPHLPTYTSSLPFQPCPYTATSGQYSPLTDWVVGGGGDIRGDSAAFPLQFFSAGAPCEQFWHGQGCPLFDVVHQAFPLSTTASPTLQDALKDGFGEAVVACDMPKPWKFPSFDSCQKRFMWTHQGSWSCSAPSHWFCAKSRRCREVSSGSWF